ncbi:MAG: hypothetical protein US18_C0011G0019 [Parcubacteria group bacterium GW2011_GWB1_36_5]|nr:MAG: hypothetical protein US12_C0011G0011 [Parcubacteria group bacterium GW2011_GWA2_36_24]KKQ07665.1 MAG: hypothetical protein US18_C0011G0019 [Parcubacteria group bacterium GW2011_GWB1_36_5]
MNTNIWLDEAGAERQQLIESAEFEVAEDMKAKGVWFWPMMAVMVTLAATLLLVRYFG